MRNQLANNRTSLPYPLMPVDERLAIWKEAQEVLGKKAQYMERELKKMRKEWDRKLPPLKSK